MRARILNMLRDNPQEYVSGEEICRCLQVSRTAIWKQVQHLRAGGYEIEAHSRLGYRLLAAPDRLLPEEVYRCLSTRSMGRELHWFDEIFVSTNDEARRLAAAGCPEGTVVVAEGQTGGRGRLARSWFAPKGGGIWMSVVLRPQTGPYEAAKFTLLAAVAVVQAIEMETGLRCGIKWPNDILWQDRKLVGILTEMNAEMEVIHYMVMGIGINVNIRREEFPAELVATTVSLSEAVGAAVSRVSLLGAVLRQLESLYDFAVRAGFSVVFDEWRNYSVTLGRVVEISSAERVFFGRALDIDDDGALLVETHAGIERVVAGDVSIRSAGCGAS